MKSKSAVRFAPLDSATFTAPLHILDDDLDSLWYQQAELIEIRNAAKYQICYFKRNSIDGKYYQKLDYCTRGLEYRTSNERRKKQKATIKYVIAIQSMLEQNNRNSNISDTVLKLAQIYSNLAQYAKRDALKDAEIDALEVFNDEKALTITEKKEDCLMLKNNSTKRTPIIETEEFAVIANRGIKRTRAARA